MSEKEKILKMLDDGKITFEQAEKLLNAINEAKGNKKEDIATNSISVEEVITPNKPLKGKFIISVDSKDGDNVKINLPLKLANLAVNMIPQKKLDDLQNDGVNLREILANINNIIHEVDEDIVSVTSKDGDVVRIYIEK